MKNVIALAALTLALSLSACTKKEDGAVEGTTTAPTETAPAAPAEMQNNPAATGAESTPGGAPNGTTSAPAPTATTPGSEGTAH